MMIGDNISRLIVQEEITKSIELKENPHQMYERIQAIPSATSKADVLDEIRTKIEKHCGYIEESHCRYCYHCNNVMGVREILKIFDKYKESEEE